MANATVIDMKARPVNSATLCFEVSGILDYLTVQLGWPVQGFPFELFYANLTVYTAAGDPSRLAYDSGGILSDPTYVKPSMLATLRRARRGRLGPGDPCAPKRILRQICNRLDRSARHATHHELYV